jgi:hypothetical protein
MNGDMGSSHFPGLVKKSTGKITPLLNIWGVAGPAKHDTHLFSDGGEEVLVNLEADWIVAHSIRL